MRRGPAAAADPPAPARPGDAAAATPAIALSKSGMTDSLYARKSATGGAGSPSLTMLPRVSRRVKSSPSIDRYARSASPPKRSSKTR